MEKEFKTLASSQEVKNKEVETIMLVDMNTSPQKPQVSAFAQANTQNSQHTNMESDHTKCQHKFKEMENKIRHLEKVIDGLLSNSQENGTGSLAGGRYVKSKAKGKTKAKIDYSAPENRGKCKYHIQYGSSAFHCTLPCIESSKPLAPKPEKMQRQSRVDQNQENSQACQ